MNENEMSTAAYWTRRENEMAKEIDAAREYAASLRGQREILSREYDAMYADAAGSTLAQREAVAAEIATLDDEIKAERAARFAAEWTLEVTTARRAEWNARATAGEFTRNGKVWMPAVAAAETAQGWRLADLKAAVALHNLS